MSGARIQLQPGYRLHVERSKSTPHHLMLFIVVSVVLHCLFLTLPGSPLAPGKGHDLITNHLDVYLGETQRQIHSPSNRQTLSQLKHRPHRTHLTVKRQTHNSPLSLHKQISASQANPSPQQWFHPSGKEMMTPAMETAASTQTQDAGSPANTSTPDPSAVALLLRQALLKHFRYPPVARQNAWQGKVVLNVRVEADGRVGSARVLRPSPYAILDRAARRAANAIGRIPAARPLLAGRSLSFRVPVAYRLQAQ